MEDATDPQLLSNLAKLGQVKIQRSKQNFKPTDQMLQILKARERLNIEDEAADLNLSQSSTSITKPSSTASSKAPSLTVPTITSLLDSIKLAKSEQALKNLAIEYDLEFEQMKSLMRFFNSPSVDETEAGKKGIGRETPAEGDDELLVRVDAFWEEPNLKGEEVRKLS